MLGTTLLQGQIFSPNYIGEMAVVAPQRLQHRYRTPARFPRVVPQGGKLSTTLDELVEAIAQAEGYYLKGSIPNRFHNPGDLKYRTGRKFFGQVAVGKGGHVIFKNDAAGWYALREQLRKMVAGESRIYSPDMTLEDVAKKYAGNWRVWAKNVSHNLGVSPTITLAELFDLPSALVTRGGSVQGGL